MACRSSDYVFVQTVVAAGVGVALVPRLALVPRPGTVALRLSDPPVRHVGAIRPDRWQAPLAAELLDLLATAT